MMFGTVNVVNNCVPQSWAHAVNSLAALHAAASLLSSGTEECPVGLEADVRVAPDDEKMEPLLHHDPIPAGEASTCVTLAAWLEELASIVRLRSGRLGVVKLDFKDPDAASMAHRLFAQSSTLYGKLSTNFLFWWNADIVAAGHDDTVKISMNPRSFSEFSEVKLHAMIHAFASRLGFGLSFGWRLPGSFNSYALEDIVRMREFLQRLAAYNADAGDDESSDNNGVCGGIPSGDLRVRPMCVTFALRYSAVFERVARENREALWQSLDELVSETQRMFTTAERVPSCFLSFWRARDEQITEEQIGLAKARFPTCTVDFN
ncbi:hypothetical protein TcCL_NonESM02687 [Trypanosoma cruzi]|uniref:Menorin-like domain-containing protein n=1 Tax=Trypanosoma cruzi (strain CL Brener) TaxID=353153 RepID=Q4DKT0_TRYCC|nr:hypothetical protein Tc00.1047053509569.80 [Trypanosoma cruzi]EAN93127.1 hypothetical protein Tc00.1047053509569.80 [Trypanosoma cruzi]RNC47495.1 hypothetical protein TcCL_NonESM02687 [Trypanosoma cruzi]|eukprot:XP_814978.1 hypothetical protein [Trypanosoma cruzi strain CL Brener]